MYFTSRHFTNRLYLDEGLQRAGDGGFVHEIATKATPVAPPDAPLLMSEAPRLDVEVSAMPAERDPLDVSLSKVMPLRPRLRPRSRCDICARRSSLRLTSSAAKPAIECCSSAMSGSSGSAIIAGITCVPTHKATHTATHTHADRSGGG